MPTAALRRGFALAALAALTIGATVGALIGTIHELTTEE